MGASHQGLTSLEAEEAPSVDDSQRNIRRVFQALREEGLIEKVGMRGDPRKSAVYKLTNKTAPQTQATATKTSSSRPSKLDGKVAKARELLADPEVSKRLREDLATTADARRARRTAEMMFADEAKAQAARAKNDERALHAAIDSIGIGTKYWDRVTGIIKAAAKALEHYPGEAGSIPDKVRAQQIRDYDAAMERFSRVTRELELILHPPNESAMIPPKTFIDVG